MFAVGCTPPLHGVECRVGKSNGQSNLPFGICLILEQVELSFNSALIWHSNHSGANHNTKVKLYRDELRYVLDVDCEGRGRFAIEEDRIVVDWHSGTGAQHYFQSIAICLWLEINAVPCIHANALTIPLPDKNAKQDNDAETRSETADFTFALLGPSGMGKSTLSAYLQDHGFTWLTDDMLALHDLDGMRETVKDNHYSFNEKNDISDTPTNSNTNNHNVNTRLTLSTLPPKTKTKTTPNNTPIIYPSWPIARLWPDSVTHILEQNCESLNRVHERFDKRQVGFGRAIDPTKRTPLNALFVLDRAEHLTELESPLEVTQLTKTDALMELLKQSMLADAYSALNLESTRLKQLLQFIDRVPVYRLRYGNGVSHLEAIAQFLKHEYKHQFKGALKHNIQHGLEQEFSLSGVTGKTKQHQH